jgi:ParB family chromosome partitioning protein
MQSKPSLSLERDIRKLFVGKLQAGSITRDNAALTVKIRAAALTPEIETELRSVVEKLFSQT